jgi:hypothetical protein
MMHRHQTFCLWRPRRPARLCQGGGGVPGLLSESESGSHFQATAPLRWPCRSAPPFPCEGTRFLRPARWQPSNVRRPRPKPQGRNLPVVEAPRPRPACQLTAALANQVPPPCLASPAARSPLAGSKPERLDCHSAGRGLPQQFQGRRGFAASRDLSPSPMSMRACRWKPEKALDHGLLRSVQRSRYIWNKVRALCNRGCELSISPTAEILQMRSLLGGPWWEGSIPTVWTRDGSHVESV